MMLRGNIIPDIGPLLLLTGIIFWIIMVVLTVGLCLTLYFYTVNKNDEFLRAKKVLTYSALALALLSLMFSTFFLVFRFACW